MVSSIEDLPDELLLDIFSYLSPIDLFISFAHLNYRFNSILCDQSVQLAIQITNHRYPEVDYFASYFTQLFIANDRIDLHQFTNIRSLTLGPSPRPTDELLHQLVDQPLKYFPYLIQLTVYQPLSTWYSPPAVRLWTQIFTNRFPSQLERCSLPGRIFAIPTTCFYCQSLRGLAIGGCSLRDFPALLSALPNLVFLSTTVWGVTDTINVSSDQHSHLTHLRIELNQQTIVLEEIRCLLSYVPYVKNFIIGGTRNHESFNIEYWYEVLISQLEFIKQFSCTIRLSDTMENKMINIDHIREYHSLFSQMKLSRRNDSLFISNQ